MSSIRFVALEPDVVDAYRKGDCDANEQPPRRYPATEDNLPCRYCLDMIMEGEEMLELAHRPFPERQPYAEIGPIFLHANRCERGGGSAEMPPFLNSPDYIVRGYTADNRIYYGSGGVVPTDQITSRATQLLDNAAIADLHLRSASNNCYHCRIERA